MLITTQPSQWAAMRFAVMTALVAFVFSIGSGTGTAIAHPGHEHKLLGEIVAVDGDRVTIKTNDGKERAFEVVATTTFLRGKQKGAKEDLKAGLRVVVTVGDGKEPLKAKRIQYAAAATAAAAGRAGS
jgi:hypothetical protein